MQENILIWHQEVLKWKDQNSCYFLKTLKSYCLKENYFLWTSAYFILTVFHADVYVSVVLLKKRKSSIFFPFYSMGSQNKPVICILWSLYRCMTHWDQRHAHTSSTKVINKGGAQGEDKGLRLFTENNEKIRLLFMFTLMNIHFITLLIVDHEKCFLKCIMCVCLLMKI